MNIRNFSVSQSCIGSRLVERDGKQVAAPLYEFRAVCEVESPHGWVNQERVTRATDVDAENADIAMWREKFKNLVDLSKPMGSN